METSQTILQGSSDTEKGAYLGAIASIATADRQATEEEIDYLSQLADAANLSQEQKEAVISAAQEISDEDAKRCLDVLKTSELKFSLVTDLIAFAKADGEYTDDEKQNIQKMADYLGVNKEQFSLLDHFTDKAINTSTANTATQPGSQNINTLAGALEPEKTDFLSSLGLKDKLQSAGIKGGGLLKGLIGVAAPMLLARMVTGGLNRNRGGGMFGGGGGMFGNSGGGMFGGGGGMFGGGGGLLGGGLGSIFSMLNGGGGGYRRSGGLLSRIFGGGF
ncbi:tellurite resistance TerB family protein [Segetibacter aerophilus]|uniref:Co-chaperone DjlA N-terminal domain-containing protein n=1 Tax=Segetibacter aerophilus TaxID=670293 RepID=A0A512B8E7_9BACT|nr:TerB family tellurite resistance protein [Segetibacter aerophilus]GEO08230.1 hypothetical protein SAE01_07260 [Segetibacter aerophilus]